MNRFVVLLGFVLLLVALIWAIRYFVYHRFYSSSPASPSSTPKKTTNNHLSEERGKSYTFPSSASASPESPVHDNSDDLAVDYFLAVDGLVGESHVPGREGDVELLSFHWSPGLRQEHAGLAEVVVVKEVDSSSPQFLMWASSGHTVNHMTLTARQPTDKPDDFVLQCTMSHVQIVGYDLQGSSVNGSGLPTETLRLHCTKMQVRTVDPATNDIVHGTSKGIHAN